MARKKKHPEHVNHERWLVSYADFMTLLFAFFVVMFASSQVDSNKLGRFTESFSKSVGIEPFSEGGPNLLAGEPGGRDEAGKATGGTELGGDGPSALESIRAALSNKALSDKNFGAIELIRQGNELVLRLPVNALFGSGDDRLQAESIPSLAAIADAIRDRPVELRVEGHTDNRPVHNGRFRSNWELSALRATAVIAVLRKHGHIEPNRLSAVGYGEFHPLADNATNEGRGKNRRVDLVLRVQQGDEKESAKVTAEGHKSDTPKAEEKPAEEKHEEKPAAEAPSAAPAALHHAPEEHP